MIKYYFVVDEGVDHNFRQMQGRLKLRTQDAFIRVVRVAAYFIEAEKQGKKVVIENFKGKTVEFLCREIFKKEARKKNRKSDRVSYWLEGDDEFDSKFREVRATLGVSAKKAFVGAVGMVSRLIEAEVQGKSVLIKGSDGEVIDFVFLKK